jgi:hypothetical protein
VRVSVDHPVRTVIIKERKEGKVRSRHSKLAEPHQQQ